VVGRSRSRAPICITGMRVRAAMMLGISLR